MARSKSSGRWLKEHFSDKYVIKSWEDGLRSRAGYKLIEMHNKDRLFTPGMTVVDLGAAPGGWSQVAARYVTERGCIIASDILPMDTIAGVEFIQGDFTEDSVLNNLLNVLASRKVNLVISDMAPNMSGNRSIDQPKSMYLCELAFDLSKQILEPGGAMVIKVFQGEGFEHFFKALKSSFSAVASRKPLASRARSREFYLVCKGFTG